MKRVRNVCFISNDDSGYREYIRYISASKRLRVKFPHPTQSNSQFTQLMSHRAEWLVRRWLQCSSTLQPERVIRYERYHAEKRRYTLCYQETDAILHDEATGDWHVVEVKLSRNPASIKKAIGQLTRSVAVLGTVGLDFKPIVVWLPLCSPDSAYQGSPATFYPDYHQVANKIFGKSNVSVISVTPESLFRWGLSNGLCTPADLEYVVAARQEAQMNRQMMSPKSQWVNNTQSNSLLATRLAEAITRRQR